MAKHKFDVQTASSANIVKSMTPKNGLFVEAGYFVQYAEGREFEKADGSKTILGVVLGIEGTYNNMGVNQSIILQSDEITCWVDGDYNVGDLVFVTAEGKATADSTNAITEFGRFVKRKVGNIGFIERV